VTEDSKTRIVDEILSSSRSRGQFLKGAAVTAAALGLGPIAASAAGLELPGRVKGMRESPSTIINIAATAEAAAVTALYHVHQAVNRNQLRVSGIAVPVNVLVGVVRGALREEQDHLAFLMGAGAKPLAMSFSFPNIIFRNATNTLAFFETAETIFIAAYLAATREFAQGRMADLATYTYQIGGVECEHRALMRAGLGQIPANNKSFETREFSTVSQAAARLQALGILKPHLKYPGARAVDHILAHSGSMNVNAGVTQRHP
jgi:Ferritin-like domain